MVDVQEVAGQKETRVSGKREAGKDPDALVFRQHTAPVALRVSHDAMAALPPGWQLGYIRITNIGVYVYIERYICIYV